MERVGELPRFNEPKIDKNGNIEEEGYKVIINIKQLDGYDIGFKKELENEIKDKRDNYKKSNGKYGIPPYIEIKLV